MAEMTKQNLKDAFAGESQAHMKYLVFADRAEREGLTNVARLFRAIAYAERVHATNHLRALQEVGSTPDNLSAAKDGEDYEIEEMYPAFKAVADLQQEKTAARTMHYALEAEKEHSVLYGDMHGLLTESPKEDPELETLWVCPVCGYTLKGDSPPDRCPICNAKGDTFKEF